MTIETSLVTLFYVGLMALKTSSLSHDDVISPACTRKAHKINGGSGSLLVSYLGKAGGDPDIPRNTLVPSLSISCRPIKVLEVKIENKEHVLATLLNIENIQAYGSSSIDLSKAVNPNSDDSNSLSVGSGGTILGNDQKQDFTISYDSDFNNDTKTSYETTTFVDGKGDKDTLKINFSNQPKQIDEIVQVKLPNNNIGFIKGSSPVAIDSSSSRSSMIKSVIKSASPFDRRANVETLKILDKEGKETVQNTSELNLPDLIPLKPKQLKSVNS